MTLYEFVRSTEESSEVTVLDKDYDIEVYFYNDEPSDDWDKAMVELSKILEVSESSMEDLRATVNLCELIEKHLDKLDGLFRNPDIDDIVEDIEYIIAGNVSENWFCRFVEVLKQ